MKTKLVIYISGMLVLASLGYAQEDVAPLSDTVTADLSTAVVEDQAVPSNDQTIDTSEVIAEDTATPTNEEDSGEMFIGMSVDEELGIDSDNAKGSDLINISVEDETLENVVQMFTKMSGINIIATSTNLTGTVTVNLTDVEWKPALTSILAMHNLALLERTPGSGVFMIVEQPEGAPEPLVVETIFLKYTTVGEVAPVVTSMLAANGTASVFAERNVLVVRTTESNMGEIKRLVDEIDINSKQVSIEAKFMELNDSATKQLGLKWNSLAGYKMQLAAGPFSSKKELKHTTDTDANNIDRKYNVSDDTSMRYEDSFGAPVQLTQPSILFSRSLSGEQVNTDKLASESENAMTFDKKSTPLSTRTISAGNVVDNAPNRVTSTSAGREQDRQLNVRDRFLDTIVESSSTVLSMDTLELVLSALKTTDGVSIISNPKMIVANGATNAFFRVGNRWPIVRTLITRGTTDSPGDGIDARLDLDIDTDYISGGYLRTGIELLVVPVVKTDNLIQAEITPTLTSKLAQDKEVAGNSWPQLQVKEIRTRFTLLSGQTVAIGGLSSTRDSKIVTKVPLLGDIPLLGKYLFSHTEDAQDQIETIIFVTLTLAEPESLLRDVGIPEDAQLVHTRMLRDKAKREKFMSDMERIKEAEDAERERMAERVKSRLLKKSK